MPTDGQSAPDGEMARNDMLVHGKRLRTHDEPDGDNHRSKRNNIRKKLSHEKYTIAWICALHIELAAAEAMLDDIHVALPGGPKDTNLYTMGNIGTHNIVIACLPSGHYGITNAALVGKEIISSFPSLKFGLMVGIGGGAPKKVDVRLGDVVVSTEVLQHDFGKSIPSGFQRTSKSIKPPQIVMKAVAKLMAQHERQPSAISTIISTTWQGNQQMESYAYPVESNDRLFKSTYEHDGSKDNCEDCNQSELVHREPRPPAFPQIYYGVIASGNTVIKHAKTRDYWSDTEDVICFEMEAAGLMDHFPCLVIRGICDYSDSHKCKDWQKYASATSAAYAKELISMLPTDTDSVQLFDQKPPSSRERSSLTQSQRESLLESLRFEQIDSRRLSIKNAHAKTCKWILQEERFLKWQDQSKLEHHHGLLWIKGKPGAGKSTLMNFIFQNFQRITKQDDKKIIIHFFFHARGEDLEKSTIGMYRSLLLQLFERIPGLESALDAVRLTDWSSIQPPDWNVETLEECFKQAVQVLGDYSVVCLIDALDECDQSQIREMLDVLERICEIAMENGQRFSVCLSSRHYPHISVNFGQELTLEGQEGHSEDIANFIQSKLKVGRSKLADKIRTELQEKASGVFMWVVLVVDILNKEHDRGHVHAMHQRLKEIPRDLNALFREIIRRYKGNETELRLCLQWVLFARAPLKPQELYFAIRCGIDDDDGALDKWDPEEILIDDMKRFIIDSSKGLTEVTKSNSATVQFIHESVRDFLRSKDGFKSIWPHIENIEGEGHESLKICCLKYSRVDVCCWDKKKHIGSSAGNEVFRSATDFFPFLEYSVRNVLFHADKAGSCGISQQNFIQSSFELDRWIQLHNTVEKQNTRRYTTVTRLTYVLAEADAAHLILASSHAGSCLEIKNERYGCPLLAAIVAKSFEAVSAFRDALIASSPPSSTLVNLESCSTRKPSQVSRNFRFNSSRSLLSHLAEYGDAKIFTLALESRIKDPNLKDKDTGRTMLMWAAGNGHEQVVNILLNTEGVDPDSRDKQDRTPLSWAAENGHEQVVNILLNTEGVDPDSRDKQDQTSLSWAAHWGHEQVIQILLNTKGVDPDSRHENGRTPLSYAAENGHKQVVNILLNTGRIDPDSRNNNGRTPLSYAAENGHEQVVNILLNTEGVDPDSRDKQDRTPLSWAAENGHEQVVNILLNTGRIDPDSRNNNGRTPLSYAAQWGREQVIQILLNTKGVDPDSSDESGITPLASVVIYGRERAFLKYIDYIKSNPGVCIATTIKLDDVANEVDLMMKRKGHKNALHFSIERQEVRAASMLLSSGWLDLNLVDELGKTALHYVSSSNAVYCFNAMKDDFLEFAKVNGNLRDCSGKTALHYAVEYDDGYIAQQLFKIGKMNPDLLDNDGNTPRILARQRGKDWFTESAEVDGFTGR